MPARLLSSRRNKRSSATNNNTNNGNTTTTTSSRKSVSSALSALSPLRRSKHSPRSPSSVSSSNGGIGSPRSSGRRLSATALAVLDDGDTSDGDSNRLQSRKRMNLKNKQTVRSSSYQLKQLLHTPVSPSATPGSGYPDGSTPRTPNSHATQKLLSPGIPQYALPIDDMHSMHSEESSTATPDDEHSSYHQPTMSYTTHSSSHLHNHHVHLISPSLSSKSIDPPSSGRYDHVESTTSPYSHTESYHINNPPSSQQQSSQQQQVVQKSPSIDPPAYDNPHGYTYSTPYPTPLVDPPEVLHSPETNEDAIRAGNEALVFIYGHNPNLYTSVFNIPSSSLHHGTPATLPSSTSNTNHGNGNNNDNEGNKYEEEEEAIVYDASYLVQLEDAIDLSYKQQFEQLNLALSCPHEHIDAAAILCGYNSFKSKHVHNPSMMGIDAKMFLEIKMDAIQRAYDILKEEESREEYDGLWRAFGAEFWNGDDDDMDGYTKGTDVTYPETDETTQESTQGSVWSEDNFVQQQQQQSPRVPGKKVGKEVKGSLPGSPRGGYLEDDYTNYCEDEVDEHGNVVYGSHGDYSYDCDSNDDDDSVAGESSPGSSYVSQDGSSHYDDEGEEEDMPEDECRHYDGNDSCVSSKLDYSYQSGYTEQIQEFEDDLLLQEYLEDDDDEIDVFKEEDEDEEEACYQGKDPPDEYEPQQEDEEVYEDPPVIVQAVSSRSVSSRSTRHTNRVDQQSVSSKSTGKQSSRSTRHTKEELVEDLFSPTTPNRSTNNNTNNKKHKLVKHHSPTDPMEFDQLINNSLDDQDYFNQFPPRFVHPNKSQGSPHEDAFDPFDLQGADKIQLSESVEFVCSLPSRDKNPTDEEEEEHEMTMGEMIAQQAAMGWPVLDMSVVSDYTDDDHTLSTRGEDNHEDDSLTSFSESIGGGSTTASGRKKKKKRRGGSVKSKVRHLVASFSGSVASATSFDDMMSLEDVLLTPNNNDDDGDSYSLLKKQALKQSKQLERGAAEPEGPNMSIDKDEEAEIETFLSIASTFTAMNAAAQQHMLQSELSNSEESSTSANSTKSQSRFVPMAKSKNDVLAEKDAIDCFPAEEDDRHSVRFNVEGEEFEYDDANDSSVRGELNICGYFDACIDGFGETIDNGLSAMEKLCIVK